MDGNGRWAEMRGLPRLEGHKRGAERAREIIASSVEVGMKALTLYAFSLENWRRPDEEVSTLMRLLEFYLLKEFESLLRREVTFKAIGDKTLLPQNIQEVLRDVENRSSQNKGMKLALALSYSGRNEIIRAVRKIMASGMKPEEVSEESFQSFLDTAGMVPPDLVIRTSGEMRVSNFLLWQAAYAEFYFTETLWPDFSREEYFLALHNYQLRERRFGTVAVRTEI